MLNPKAEEHPSYSITPEMRKEFPKESAEWEALLKNVGIEKYRGCFTCALYNPVNHDMPDTEEFGIDEDGDPIYCPWNTEAAWVNCNLNQVVETPLTINCPNWKRFESRYLKK